MRWPRTLLAASLATAAGWACSSSHPKLASPSQAGAAAVASLPATATTLPPAGSAPATTPSGAGPSAATARVTTSTTAPPPTPTTAAAPPAPAIPAGVATLAGKVVAIDPGHNGGNGGDPGFINSTIFNGRANEACDTTGTATDSGYTEAQFNWNVALLVSADLRAEGASVVLTRTSNTGVGPCVTQRAAIANLAHANAAVSIHADGGPAGGRGFAILEPVADGPNDAIIGSSQVLGSDLRDAFGAGTGEGVSTYDGVNGIQARSDLAGTNLSTVPKVFIECANMRNATDAALLTSPAWQQSAARAIAAGLTRFLTGR